MKHFFLFTFFFILLPTASADQDAVLKGFRNFCTAWEKNSNACFDAKSEKELREITKAEIDRCNKEANPGATGCGYKKLYLEGMIDAYFRGVKVGATNCEQHPSRNGVQTNSDDPTATR